MRDAPSKPTILIVEANTRQADEAVRASGRPSYSELYRAIVLETMPAARVTVIAPFERPAIEVMAGIDLDGIDGVLWTGSALHAYAASPEMAVQASIFGTLFDARIPMFGSCWALQLMATVLGGKVRRNPWGREIGIARAIDLTDDGRRHPMFAGKARRFDAPCTHLDDVEVLPAGCRILARNEAGIQAAAIDDDGRSFWGVQYHPEFGLADIAAIIERRVPDLIAERIFATQAEALATCDSLREIEARPELGNARRQVYGISADLVDRRIRHLEIANWMSAQVGRKIGSANLPVPGRR